MKQVIITDKYTIDKINNETSWIISEIESFAKYLTIHNFNQEIQENIDIYSCYIIESCNLIRDLIEIKE